jgi:transcriptional regulator NrdR family protein
MMRNGNACPCCLTKNPKIEDINRILKNQLIKAQINCISCKNQFPYETIDEHEIHCGKCTLCVAKLSPALSIVQHNLNDCQKIEFRCV